MKQDMKKKPKSKENISQIKTRETIKTQNKTWNLEPILSGIYWNICRRIFSINLSVIFSIDWNG